MMSFVHYSIIPAFVITAKNRCASVTGYVTKIILVEISNSNSHVLV